MPKKKQSTVELAQEHKLTIQYRNVEELVPYENNPRLHSDSQVDQIANSIKQFGWTNPILLDGTNGILCGHGRLMAARQLGMESVPCIDIAHLTDDQKRAYIISDNQLTIAGEWSPELLRVELQKLEEVDFDMSLLGFQPQELQEFMAPDPNEGLTDPDAVPETPTTPVTVMGDVWLLDPYYECESCHKIYAYDEGKHMDACSCG
jgi:hypothetical protein